MSDTPSSVSRRRLFKAAGAAGATAVIPLRIAQAQPATPKPYEFLSAEEAQFVESAVARLIPQDELGPGALQAGVPRFIDRQLAGPWGAGARLYQGGPWRKGTESQGYQQPLTPAGLFRMEVREIDVRRFAGLAPAAQDEFLKRLEEERKDFFELLLALTIEGFFADPMYGGNQGMAGWRLVGFPGAYANFYDLVGRNAPFTAPPMSIARHGQHEKK